VTEAKLCATPDHHNNIVLTFRPIVICHFCCSQRGCAVGNLDQRWLRNERNPIASAQRCCNQTGAVAMHSRGSGRGRGCALHFARFFLGMGSDARVSK